MAAGSTKVTRRVFLRQAAGFAGASMLSRRLGAEDADRPNVILVLIDDLRWDALSCTGHPFVRTPHIDRLAREGARFGNAFVTTSLCSPSRASILTGQHAWTHGVRDNRTAFDDALATFPVLLNQSGYRTALIGKWHMGDQTGRRRGFDDWISFRGQGAYYDPVLQVNGETVSRGGYVTDLLTRYAVDWLKEAAASPFCLVLSHKAVHEPFAPAVRHSRLFENTPVPLPASFHEDRLGKPRWMSERVGAGRTGDIRRHERIVRDYFRTLVAVDDSVGRIIGALEEAGQLDNTLIIFAGDNGYLHGEHGGLNDKRLMYEESIRIPLLIRYPQCMRPSSVIDGVALNVDICPTVLQAVGLRVPESVQGRSLLPLLGGRPRDWRTEFFYNYDFEPQFPKKPGCRGVRTTQWKYTEYPGLDDIPELYDLRDDPGEMRNLATDPAYSQMLADMRHRMERLMRETEFRSRDTPQPETA